MARVAKGAKKASPTFVVGGHALSDEAKAKIIAALGNDDALAILDTETALGNYTEGAADLDGIPRPADYVAEFKWLETKATELLVSTRNLSGYFRDQFQLKGQDLTTIEVALAALKKVSESVIADMDGEGSLGAPPNMARRITHRELRDVFEKYYRGPITEAVTAGAIKTPSEQDRRECEFVMTALLDAKIITEIRGLERAYRDYREAISSK
jgi:hypothetical protein